MDHSHHMPDRHRKHEHHHEHAQHKHHDHKSMLADFKKRFWVSLILSIAIVLLSPMIQHFFGLGDRLRFPGDIYILFLLSTAVFFYGGWPFLSGLVNELRAKQPGMMTLIGLAITTAYIYSTLVVFGLKGEIFFWELATLVVIMLLGHWIEMKSVAGASEALEELAKLLPAVAHKISPKGELQDIDINKLQVSDRVIVKPGEKIPADGDVVEGESTVNEAMLTGESTPVVKGVGAQVIAGSINGEGALQVEVKKRGEDSFLSQMIRLVEEAQKTKSRTQDLANRAAYYLTLIAIAAGAVTLLAWLIFNKNLAFALERAVTVMVITCPHALGLAIPLVVAISTALGAKNGLLVRNRAAFEQGRNIQALIFDKTGTLTEGKFGVTDQVPLSDHMQEEDILKYAASLESHSEHPIAKGIAASAKELFPVKNFQSMTGKGVMGEVNDKQVKVVSSSYLKDNQIEVSNKKLERLSMQGKTVVFVLIDGEVVGAIAVADVIRPESKRAVKELKNMGIQCMMVTGDNKQVAKWVSEEIGLDAFFAEVPPQSKALKVKEIQNKGLIVGMVGDGVNDAPALAGADVGIAIGAGTDVAQETADIILVKNNPLDVVSILNLSRATYKKMIQNLAWATGYNVFAIPVAAGILAPYGIILSPAVGAVLMSLSTVIVAINARLLRV